MKPKSHFQTPFWVWVIVFFLMCFSLTYLSSFIINFPDEFPLGIILAFVSFFITYALYNKVNTGKFQIIRILKLLRFTCVLLFGILIVFGWYMPITLIVEYGFIKGLVEGLKFMIIAIGVLGGLIAIIQISLRLMGDKSTIIDEP